MLILSFTNRSPGYNNVTAQGEYELIGSCYFLRRWRIAYDRNNGVRHEGEWHRIHGNRRKDIGPLRLCLPAGQVPQPSDNIGVEFLS